MLGLISLLGFVAWYYVITEFTKEKTFQDFICGKDCFERKIKSHLEENSKHYRVTKKKKAFSSQIHLVQKWFKKDGNVPSLILKEYIHNDSKKITTNVELITRHIYELMIGNLKDQRLSEHVYLSTRKHINYPLYNKLGKDFMYDYSFFLGKALLIEALTKGRYSEKIKEHMNLSILTTSEETIDSERIEKIIYQTEYDLYHSSYEIGMKEKQKKQLNLVKEQLTEYGDIIASLINESTPTSLSLIDLENNKSTMNQLTSEIKHMTPKVKELGLENDEVWKSIITQRRRVNSLFDILNKQVEEVKVMKAIK